MNPYEVAEWWVENYPKIGKYAGIGGVALFALSLVISQPDAALASLSLQKGVTGVALVAAGFDFGLVVAMSATPFLPHSRNEKGMGVKVGPRMEAYGLAMANAVLILAGT